MFNHILTSMLSYYDTHDIMHVIMLLQKDINKHINTFYLKHVNEYTISKWNNHDKIS